MREKESASAADVVSAGGEAEKEAGELARERREREAERKSLQSRISQLEDESRRLKAPPTAAEAQKRGWLDGITFFEGIDE